MTLTIYSGTFRKVRLDKLIVADLDYIRSISDRLRSASTEPTRVTMKPQERSPFKPSEV